jgi:hypothetical protein
MTAKEKLRRLVDALSEQEAEAALVLVEQRDDPMLQALAAAPIDDEPSSPEEDASARNAQEAYRRGEATPANDFKRELELD